MSNESRGDSGVWLFGYGSIMWKTGFNFEDCQPSQADGWCRRFWQASTDHRGTPEQPGRVVTLAQSPGESCWGLAYQLPFEQVESIIEELDLREKGGYERVKIPLQLSTGQELTALTYVAKPDNPYFLGAASDAEIAQQINRSTGPSGPNTDYIMSLKRTLDQHQISDPHITRLVRLLEDIQESDH